MKHQSKPLLTFKNLGHAIDKLEAVLQESIIEHDFALDAAIQRFEFVIELYWKVFKHLLEANGKVTSLPKQALQEAFAAGWINDEKKWLSMLLDRNLTSHTYDHDTALQIYAHIKSYSSEFRKVYEYLQNHVISTLQK